MAGGSTSIWGKDPNVPHVARESLSIYPKKNPTYAVTVTINNITCVPEGLSNPQETEKRTIEFSFRDIIGCDCLRGKTDGDGNAYLVLYNYPHRKKLTSKKTARRRTTLTLTFDQMTSYAENQEAAQKWKLMIQAILEGLQVRSINDLSRIQLPTPKRMLVLVNPCSGPGRALSIFQERIVPMFAEAGIHFNMILTEYAGHAREVVKTVSLSEWYGIVIVSGDGLVYEVINGLMERDDWQEAIKIPLTALPGGSGNALAVSLNYYAGEPYLDNMVLHSTYLVAKHKVMPMDLVAVDTIKERVYSFLSVTWAIMADVDIESEKYRSLGGARFTVGGLARILNLRVYPGRLSFLPVEPYVPPTDINSTYKGTLTRSQSEYQYAPTRSGRTPQRSQSVTEVEKVLREKTKALKIEEDVNDNNFEPNSNTSVDSSDAELERVTITASPNGTDEQTADGSSTNVSTPNGTGPPAGHSSAPENLYPNGHGEPSGNKIPTPLLSPLSEPVPSDWVTIEDDFLVFCASYQSHLGDDFCAHPESTFNDGLIYLGFVRNAPTGVRMKLLSMMIKKDDGSHIHIPEFEIVKVKAFRLEPLNSEGTICVDGEKVDYGPIQAQILPGISRVMAQPK